MNKVLIQAEDLGIIRQNRRLFRRLSIRICAGEMIHLTGENGSGKTTLLQMLAGTLPTTYGTITRHVPLLFLGHNLALKPLLSVRENLYYASRLYHETAHEKAQTIIANALENVKLSSFIEQQVRYLSAGQQHRVQLARLWLNSPPLWLLDEPLTALDTPTINQIMMRCLTHIKQGGSVLITSHQPLPIPDTYLRIQPIHKLCHPPAQ